MSESRPHLLEARHRGQFVDICWACRSICIDTDTAHEDRCRRLDNDELDISDTQIAAVEVVLAALIERGVADVQVCLFAAHHREAMPGGMCPHNARLAGIAGRRIF